MAGVGGPRVILGVGFWAQQPIIVPGGPVVTQVFDLPTGWTAPARIEQTTALNLVLTTLAPPPPDNTKIFRGVLRSLPESQVPYRIEQTTTWRQVGMLGQDVVPGRQVYELTPKPPQRLPDYTVAWRQVGMLGLDRLPVGVQSFALPPPLPPALFQTWASPLNLLLAIAPAALPAGNQVTDRPPLSAWTLDRTVALDLQQTTLATVVDTTKIFRGVLRSLPDRGPQWIEETFALDPLTLRAAPPSFYWQTYNLFDQPNPRAPYRIEQTWTWRQVGMLGLDQLPVGDQIFELSPRPAQRLPDYAVAWRQVGMLGLDRLPAGQQVYELARAPQRLSDYTVVWRQVGMLGLDQLPVGDQVFELSPKAPQRLPDYTTAWRQVGMLGQDSLPFGTQSIADPVRQVWYRTWELNLALYQVTPQIPAGAQVYDLTPIAALRASDLRTWIQSVNLALTVTPGALPFNQYDWPLPRTPAPIDQTFTWRQVGMLGQDRLPTGQQITDLTPKLAPRLPLYSWEWRQVGMLGQDRLPIGAQLTELTPKAPQRLSDYTTAWRQVGMLGLDQLPIGKIVQELTSHRFIAAPIEQTTAWRQVDKIGLDRMLVGQQITDLWPRAALRQVDLANWVSSVNLALTTAAPVPFYQATISSYALPDRGPIQPDRSFIGPNLALPFAPPPPPVTGTFMVGLFGGVATFSREGHTPARIK